jgi:hypothetical protein
MKLFKPIFIHKVDYSNVSFVSCKRREYKGKQRFNYISIEPYSDEARLVEELEAKIKSRIGWLIDWCYANIKPSSSIHKVSGNMLAMAIERVARDKVRKDWEAYTSSILNLNTLYIYALEARYKQPCGYTDNSVVIGDNRWGWRGDFVAPHLRPYGRIQ